MKYLQVLSNEMITNPVLYDRRKKPRIYVPFHATVQGVDENGEQFEINTILDNFSSNSLYLRLLPRVKQGAELSVTIGLSTTEPLTQTIPRVALDGVVQRIDQKSGGACGVVVTFARPRFL